MAHDAFVTTRNIFCVENWAATLDIELFPERIVFDLWQGLDKLRYKLVDIYFRKGELGFFFHLEEAEMAICTPFTLRTEISTNALQNDYSDVLLGVVTAAEMHFCINAHTVDFRQRQS